MKRLRQWLHRWRSTRAAHRSEANDYYAWADNWLDRRGR